MGLQRAKGESTVLSFIGWSLVCCEAVLLLTCAPLNERMHTGYGYQTEAKLSFTKWIRGFLKDLLQIIHTLKRISICVLEESHKFKIIVMHSYNI